jgi:hypothetical protein
MVQFFFVAHECGGINPRQGSLANHYREAIMYEDGLN